MCAAAAAAAADAIYSLSSSLFNISLSGVNVMHFSTALFALQLCVHKQLYRQLLVYRQQQVMQELVCKSLGACFVLLAAACISACFHDSVCKQRYAYAKKSMPHCSSHRLLSLQSCELYCVHITTCLQAATRDAKHAYKNLFASPWVHFWYCLLLLVHRHVCTTLFVSSTVQTNHARLQQAQAVVSASLAEAAAAFWLAGCRLLWK